MIRFHILPVANQTHSAAGFDFPGSDPAAIDNWEGVDTARTVWAGFPRDLCGGVVAVHA